MAVKVKMPGLSEDAETGLLVRWLVDQGQQVKAGEVIAEIETDKAALDLEAPATGILLKKRVEAGTEVPVDNTVAIIDDSISERTENAEEVSDAEEPEKPHLEPESRVSSSARRMAEQQGIDPTRLEGSGAEGRVVKADVERALDQGFGDKSEGDDKVRTASTIFPPRRLSSEKRKISKNQAVVGKTMSKSMREIPHLDLSVEVDVQPAAELLKQIRESGRKLANEDVILTAVARALCDNPVYNSHYEGEHLQVFDSVDLAFVSAVESDLFTPIIERADRRSIFEINSRRRELKEKLKSGKLSSFSFTDATFTVYNLANQGIDKFSAIINPPQVGILAVGRVRQQPVVKAGECIPERQISLTLSSDHRAVNATAATSFLTDIKNYLEKPVTLL